MSSRSWFVLWVLLVLGALITAALFVVLNYQPLMESLALGQANLLLLFLVSLAW